MNKYLYNKKIIYIIVGIVFVLVFGVTYAYFNVTLRNAVEPTQMVTETGTLELNYIDGDYINGEKVFPGWSANKTIVVTNVGSLDAYYKIFWKELTNNFEQDELILKAVCTSYEHYGEANQVISGSCNDIEETPVANVAGAIKENIGVEVGFTHVYSFTFTFKEMSLLQNYNQGKTFGGVLNIDDSYGLYTMNGTLLDSEGEPLASTQVLLSNGKSATTNAQGRFTIEEVDEGNYQLTIGEVTDTLTLETGRELGASGNTITSNIENKEINVTIQLGDSTISYDVTEPTSYDLNMLALYVDGVKVSSLNSNEKYELVSSACTNGETVTWDNNQKKISVNPLSTSTKCTINFNSLSNYTNTLVQKIYDDNTKVASRTTFNSTFTDVTTGKIYYTNTNTESTCSSSNTLTYVSPNVCKSYYFAGNTTNNFVKFGNYLWRIIRINEDQSVRLLYAGKYEEHSSTSNDAFIFTTGYQEENYDNAFVGYMMGIQYWLYNLSTSYSEAHSNTNSSAIKAAIDNWYKQNIFRYHDNYVSKTAIYCNDRSVKYGNGIGSNTTYYSGYYRMISTFNPQYKCPQDNDKFTVSTSTGNGDLTYAVALLTADEVAYSGSYFGGFAPNNYIYDNYQGDCWTMTPSDLTLTSTNNVPSEINSNMISYGNGVLGRFQNSKPTTLNINVRPVLSLKSCVKYVRGNGNETTPYEVTIDSSCEESDN